MPTYKIKIEAEEIFKADNEEQAEEKFWEEVESTPQQTLATYLSDHLTKHEVCPHCETELEPKMFDVDGTNLSEHNTCPKCGYGSPALL